MGGEKNFPNRPKNRQDIFAFALKRYAELITQNDDSSLDPVLNTIAKWLCVKELFVFLRGIQSVLEHLLIPGVSPEKIGYVRLISVLFDQSNLLSVSVNTQEVFYTWLKAVAKGKISPPINQVSLRVSISEFITNKYRKNIMPIWGDDVFNRIDSMLNTLKKSDAELLRLRFGIGHKKPMILQEIADLRNLTRARIHQIETKIINELKSRITSINLETFVHPIYFAE